jgi:YbbR domain-containing protein
VTLSRNILIFLGALIFSALLWAYVRLSAGYEAEIDLPVKLTAPKGYALASGLPERLHARVRGAGWQILLMNFTNNSNFQFDLSERALPATELLTLHTEELSNAAVIPSEVHIEKMEPDSLELLFAKAVTKRVTIVPRLDVVPAKGYTIAGDPAIAPHYVTVSGAERVLDSLTTFPTQTITVHNAREDVDKSVPFSDSLENYVAVPNEQTVSVHVDIQPIGERQIAGVAVVVEALPPQYDMVLIPGTISVVVRGGVDELAKLTSSAIAAHVMYNPLVLDTAHTLSPVVDMPKGIFYLSSDPANVKFILRRKNAAH